MDDLLPFLGRKTEEIGPYSRLIFAECYVEFWGPLVEKAYAKLHGSYEALGIGAFGGEAMVDLTGEDYLVASESRAMRVPMTLVSTRLQCQGASKLADDGKRACGAR